MRSLGAELEEELMAEWGVGGFSPSPSASKLSFGEAEEGWGGEGHYCYCAAGGSVGNRDGHYASGSYS